jgi:hypothetical protein
MREAVEEAYENLNSAQNNEYLVSGSVEEALVRETLSPAVQDSSVEKPSSPTPSMTSLEDLQSHQIDAPTLALTPDQFAMIQSLDAVGWRKYSVYIHNDRHSHAAIIVRMNKDSFVEGYTVLRHWLDDEFLIE